MVTVQVVEFLFDAIINATMICLLSFCLSSNATAKLACDYWSKWQSLQSKTQSGVFCVKKCMGLWGCSKYPVLGGNAPLPLCCAVTHIHSNHRQPHTEWKVFLLSMCMFVCLTLLLQVLERNMLKTGPRQSSLCPKSLITRGRNLQWTHDTSWVWIQFLLWFLIFQ